MAANIYATNNNDGVDDRGCPEGDRGSDLPVPNELLWAILGHLDPVDAVAARWVSRRWKAYCAPTAADIGSAYSALLATRGHLAVLKWARRNGCPWAKGTCGTAAGAGHLDVLQWIVANGCPWDKDVVIRAAKGGHMKVLRWLKESTCP
nr:ankyrin repeat [Pandoravirus massiliensis]